ELLATNSAAAQPGASAFIVGLLSLLDVLLEVPMEKILMRLELSGDVGGALLGRGRARAAPRPLAPCSEVGEVGTGVGRARRTAGGGRRRSAWCRKPAGTASTPPPCTGRRREFWSARS